MASVPTSSRQIEGEHAERMTDFIFCGSKLIADGEGNLKITRWLLPGREPMTNLESVLKNEDMTWPIEAYKSHIFGLSSRHVQMWEHQRIDDFELLCWGGLVRVPWTAGISNQWILKEINTEDSLKGLMLKIKLQNFVHLRQRADSLEKTMIFRKGWKQEEQWVREVEKFG